MRLPALVIGFALSVVGGAAVAQQGASVRVQPGYFCAQNKCMRFSQDLTTVQIQGRRPASVRSFNLRSNPVVSSDEFREIFLKGLYAPNITSTDR